MDISVIIPTRERPAKIAECLRHLREQTIDVQETEDLTGRFEVLVGIDGPDPESARAARAAWGHDPKHAQLHVVECPRAGYSTARNKVLELARGRWILSLNDDVYARPGLIATHAREQVRALNRGRPAVIVGDSPWRVFPDDSLFDRLVRETSMIFFYDKMNVWGVWGKGQRGRGAKGQSDGEESEADKDWGFRHCFGLNHSISAGALKEIGGYAIFPAIYGYEDNEVAWRLRERFGMPVLYRPRASVEHDHRYTASGYLEREEKLGYAAWGFALQSPGCAREMFGRDITSRAEIEYSREFVEREAKTAERLRTSVEGLGEIPANAIAGSHAAALINVIYEQHLLLKRWLWRRGLVRAADEAGVRTLAA